MNITKVTVKKIEGQQTLRGVASVVLDDEIKIRDMWTPSLKKIA